MRPSKRAVPATVLIGACLFLQGCGVVDSLRARNHLNKGVAAYTSKRYEQAIAEFTKAAELDPDLIDAKLYLAHSYRVQFVPGIPSSENQEKADRAIAAFEDVVKSDPNNSNALASIAGMYGEMGRFEDAITWYQKRIEAEPKNPEPHYGIGSCYFRLSSDLTGQDGGNVPNLTDDQKTQAMDYAVKGIEALDRALALKAEHPDAIEYKNYLFRERAYLAVDEEEKDRLEREASKMALEALQLRKKLEREAELERQRLFRAESDG